MSDRKSTRLNSSHLVISYAVFCLKKRDKRHTHRESSSFSRVRYGYLGVGSWCAASNTDARRPNPTLTAPRCTFFFFFFFFNPPRPPHSLPSPPPPPSTH